ncbi:mCG62440, isoform CRA_a [Mus musculus]|nr:mCG62440, isoform CRA_a [Mus musculus]
MLSISVNIGTRFSFFPPLKFASWCVSWWESLVYDILLPGCHFLKYRIVEGL